MKLKINISRLNWYGFGDSMQSDNKNNMNFIHYHKSACHISDNVLDLFFQSSKLQFQEKTAIDLEQFVTVCFIR